MIYLKSFLVGMVCALAVVGCYVMMGEVVFLFLMARTAGSGGIGAVSADLGPMLFLAIAAFAGGSYWAFRRASRIG